jgi:phage terminase large subunit-like protein
VTFRLTEKQAQALKLASGPATHVMLEGGGRSGKTFLHLRNVVMRALKAENSRHIAARFRFNHIKTSMIADTFPKVMRLCYPQVKVELSRTDWFARFPNKSELWFAGLDDKERTEKILGMEFATIYLNETSELPWSSRQMVMTRLAQKASQLVDGIESPLKLRVFYDCNPPSKAHWTYRLFHQKLDPETREPIARPEDFVRMLMNPRDNLDNISPEYLEQLAGLGARMRRRFEFGEYAESISGALFDEAVIDRWRVMDGELPDMVRKVVAVDPSGSGDENNADNDEIGIVVAGLGTDGRGYIIEDVSVKGGPGTWGRVATDAYDRHAADTIVGETNYGGDMVRATIQTARPRTPFKKVTATRGKAVRAEPFSALYEQGKIRHVGLLPKLEDELCAMSTTGYLGSGSPNRADAAIWALTELFPGMVAGPKVERTPRERTPRGHGAWMS